MRRILLGAAAIAAVAMTLVAGTPKAHANIVLEYSLDGGSSWTTLLTGPSGSTQATLGTTVGSFAITVASVSSDSPGTTHLAQVLSASLDIQNGAGSTQSIEFAISDIDFTAPITPPKLSLNSHIGGTVGSSGANQNNATTFQSCISTTNANLTSCAGATAASTVGSPSITTPNAFANDQFATITSLTAPYSITSIWDLTLGAGADLGFQARASLAPVPEPVTLSVLGTGLVALGIIRRRRRT